MSDHPNVDDRERDDGSDLRPGPRCPGQDLHRRLRVPSPRPGPDGRRPRGCGRSARGRSVRCSRRTNGQIELDQQFCIGADGWAAEWEHATLHRNGNTLESRNAFVYRFDGDRIAEMWMFLGALAPKPPRRSSPDRSRGRARLCGVVRAIEDARAACDDRRWGDAWRLRSTRRPRQPRRRRPRPGAQRRRTSPGHDEEGFACWIRAHQRLRRRRVVHRAALFGAKLAQGFGFKGDLGRCRGWVDRSAGSSTRPSIDCVEQGYLQWGLGMLRIFEAGDLAGAHAHFVHAGKIGARFAHRELVTVARIDEGRMLIYLGDIAEGLALLDEAMVAIEAGELSPVATGDAYCTVIDACSELFDLGAAEPGRSRWHGGATTQQELVLVPRALLRAPRRGPPSCSAVARRPRRSATRLRSARRTRPSRRPRRRLAPSRATSSACSATSTAPRPPIGAPASTAATPNPASRCSGSPRAGATPPTR